MINPRKILARCLCQSHEVAHRALLKSEKIDKPEHHNIFSIAPVSGSGSEQTSNKYEQKIKSPKTADERFDPKLFDFISETKKSFKKTLCPLDFLIKYLQSPCDDTAKPLILLTDREEMEKFTIIEEKFEQFCAANECFQNDKSQTKGDDEETSTLQTCNSSLEEVSKRVSKQFSSMSINEALDALELSKGHEKDMKAKIHVLENKIRTQEEEIKSLKMENEEISAHLGELLVKKDAKKSKEKKADAFYQVFLSSSTNSVVGTDSLVHVSNCQAANKEMMLQSKDSAIFHGRGQSSLTQQMYKSLSFSLRQDDASELVLPDGPVASKSFANFLPVNRMWIKIAIHNTVMIITLHKYGNGLLNESYFVQ